ncbi:MAG: saccharopine dehydrogenase NADP-binding domain-containing protein [Leptospiraceae bacterium]|nr:saccharopine dehydrogenase NADP-binding domain-containing protein [Leptospiraceae bacterium]MCP5511219.1 saccharopine dehydrogenase NADP-binding domain-containing protein [Leptospiraceae bacterium]
MVNTNKKYDIILFGATGFTGKLTAEYLVSKMNSEKFTLALAGRSHSKLSNLKMEILNKFRNSVEIGIIIADVGDEESINRMVESTRVLITTVGPYLKYGETILKACAREGVHYLDITGEGAFVQTMYEKYNSLAVANKARIVNCCGYDSIPADLGTFFTIKNLPEEESKEVECFISTSSKNIVSALQSFSGGTWHSALGFMNFDEMERQNDSYQKIRSQFQPRNIYPIPTQFRYRDNEKLFGAPLPFVDVEVVLRSAGNLPEYGPDFSYGHYLSISGIPQLFAGLVSVGTVFTMAQIPQLKDFLLSLKSSGDGPDEDVRSTNQFKHSFVGRSATKTIRTTVTGGDPGYGDTSKMLGESALCLLNDKLDERYGVITPVMAMGNHLLSRLSAIGIRFSVIENEPKI